MQGAQIVLGPGDRVDETALKAIAMEKPFVLFFSFFSLCIPCIGILGSNATPKLEWPGTAESEFLGMFSKQRYVHGTDCGGCSNGRTCRCRWIPYPVFLELAAPLSIQVGLARARTLIPKENRKAATLEPPESLYLLFASDTERITVFFGCEPIWPPRPTLEPATS